MLLHVAALAIYDFYLLRNNPKAELSDKRGQVHRHSVSVKEPCHRHFCNTTYIMKREGLLLQINRKALETKNELLKQVADLDIIITVGHAESFRPTDF